MMYLDLADLEEVWSDVGAFDFFTVLMTADALSGEVIVEDVAAGGRVAAFQAIVEGGDGHGIGIEGGLVVREEGLHGGNGGGLSGFDEVKTAGAREIVLEKTPEPGRGEATVVIDSGECGEGELTVGDVER